MLREDDDPEADVIDLSPSRVFPAERGAGAIGLVSRAARNVFAVFKNVLS
jgi:hypothetical protein